MNFLSTSKELTSSPRKILRELVQNFIIFSETVTDKMKGYRMLGVKGYNNALYVLLTYVS